MTLDNDVILSLPAMDTGLGLLVIIMAANPMCWTLCCFHLSSVMDFADNFNALGYGKLTLAVPKALSTVLARLWLLPRPGSIASVGYITSLRKWYINHEIHCSYA